MTWWRWRWTAESETGFSNLGIFVVKWEYYGKFWEGVNMESVGG